MLNAVCAAPRGLAARVVWFGLTLYQLVKEQAASPPSVGEMMKTEGPAPGQGSGEPPPMVAHGVTHTGKRPRNEDCHLIREDLGLVIVADGFGGAAGGDVAARVAVDEIAGCFGVQGEETVPNLEGDALVGGLTVATARFAIEHAHMRVRFEARRTGPPGMRTAVALLMVAGPRVVVGHAGSVRVYRFRADTLAQLTEDPPAAALACPVGAAQERVELGVRPDPWQPGDRYVLCTAGLHRVLGPEAIRCTLAERASVAESVTALVGRALHAGAADNLTAVVAAPMQRRVLAEMRKEDDAVFAGTTGNEP